MTERMQIRRPDDWHLHLRDGDMLRAVLPATASVMGRAMVMPNLKPPVVDTASAAAYRSRILDALPEGSNFRPFMACYLTDRTDADDLVTGFESGVLKAVKLYPAGATTNSDSGVTNLDALSGVLERMADIGMPLLVHGEVTAAEIDLFDREARFLETVLEPLLTRHTKLRVVVEHATTSEAVEFVRANADRVGCTITPQHLLANRNHMLVGGIRPHFYCLPILKRASHQQALIEAATSGEANFFLGTDSAPHAKHTKETSCGCAGCYTAPAALELYAEAFERAGELQNLEAFASVNGPTFYGVPVNEDTVTLTREPWQVPAFAEVSGPAEGVVPFYAGETLQWRVAPIP